MVARGFDSNRIPSGILTANAIIAQVVGIDDKLKNDSRVGLWRVRSLACPNVQTPKITEGGACIACNHFMT